MFEWQQFALLVVLAIATMVWGDTPLHAWLDRCLWGQLQDERYTDMSTEQDQYQLAVTN